MKLILTVFSFLFLFQANATHIVGGEIFYDSLGNNNYKVTIILYRDCNSNTGYDAILGYTVFNANNNIEYDRYAVSLLSQTPLPIDYNDPCIVPPSGLCVDVGVYIDTITLPVNPNGYYISYQRCCWANNILNMVDPGDVGLTLTCNVPGSNLVGLDNNAARFNNVPPLVLCSENTLDFDHSATDPDGDSLRYFLCDPDNFDPPGTNFNPNPEFPGPYLPIAWESTFSAIQPFGPGSSISIDSVTGQLSVTPLLVGNFMTGVCLEEYRNGVLINRKNRTFNLTVVACDKIIPFAISAAASSNSNLLVEDCGEQFIYFTRLEATDTLVIDILKYGTATNGVDFNALPSTFSMLPGTFNDTLSFVPFFDSIDEPTETLRLSFRYFDVCANDFDSLVVETSIVDYRLMGISTPIDSINICPDLNEVATVSAIVTDGIAPFSFDWKADFGEFYPSLANVQINPSYITEFKNPYFVKVTDACGKEIVSDTIDIYNQCPIIVPNVVTLNGDKINELFIIKNIEDVPNVEFSVFNRWGQLIYNNSSYDNSWDVRHKNGTLLLDGVYFYTLLIIGDEKYTYDDKEKTKYQAQGSFQVLR